MQSGSQSELFDVEMGDRLEDMIHDLGQESFQQAHAPDGVDDTVCEKYDISKEKGAQFCQTCRDPSWEVCSLPFKLCAEKGKGHPEVEHYPPHVLSRGGYEYLEHKLLAEKTRKKLEEAAQSGSVDGVIDPPSPVRRHVKWKMARTKKIGEMTTEAAKEIAEKIASHFQLTIRIIFLYFDSFEEQASQGSFVPQGHQDVLTTAIGRPEHPRCVRAAGVSVTIKKYFGSAPRTSCNSSSLPPAELQQLTQQIRDQLEESITEKGLTPPLEPLVGPSGPRVSTKESYVDPSGNNPETGDSDKCGLYIEAQVGVEEVKDPDVPVPVPTDEVSLVGQTIHTFLAWLTHLTVVSPEKPPQNPDPEVDNLLYLMTLTIPELFLRPYQVTWDVPVFGVFNPNFPLYIKHEDLFEIIHGGQWLSISRSGQSQFEAKRYIKSWMQSSKRNVYLGAYLNGGHWQMVVILPMKYLVVWFCSLHNRPYNYLKGIINSALKGLDDAPQPKSKVVARWLSSIQKGSTECGDYVMHWMSTIILGSFRNNWKATIGAREIKGASDPVGTLLSPS
ncbi:hypothetical protein GmHk_03G006793 [Glycine max]|nr:hypothetical protein GmHk_03G006793 [Glycine max]